MIIDVHAHWGPWFFSMKVGDPAINLAMMDRYGIDLAVVSATEAVIYDHVPATGRWRESSRPRIGSSVTWP